MRSLMLWSLWWNPVCVSGARCGSTSTSGLAPARAKRSSASLLRCTTSLPAAAALSALTCHFQSQELRGHPAAAPSPRICYFHSQFLSLKHAPSLVCIYAVYEFLSFFPYFLLAGRYDIDWCSTHAWLVVAEEPLGQYRKSCAFCRGHLDILHPMGRKFVCGNDKDRFEQQLLPCGSIGLEMPFTCRLGPASVNSSHGEKED